MPRRKMIHSWVVMLCLLVGCSMSSYARLYTVTGATSASVSSGIWPSSSMPSSQGYSSHGYASHGYSSPVYSSPVYSSSAPSNYRVQMSDYQFHSTSVYLPAERSGGVSFVGSPVMAPFSGPRRNPWSEFSEDQEGIGELADPSPISSPLILLFFAAVYMLIRFVRSRSASQLAQ